MKNPVISLLSVCVLGAALPIAASADTILNLGDISTSGGNQNTWIAPAAANSGAANGLSFTGTTTSELKLNWSSTGNAYFVVNFDAVQLANPGDSIRLDYSVTFNGLSASAQAFRVALLSMPEKSGSPFTGLDYRTSKGYRADYSQNASEQNGIRVRNSAGDSLFVSGSAPVLTPVADHGDFTAGVLTGTSDGYFELRLLADNRVQITSFLQGAEVSTVIASGGNLFTEFNSLAIFANAGAAGGLSFSNLTITSPAIPESGSVALISSAVAALAILAMRRKKR